MKNIDSEEEKNAFCIQLCIALEAYFPEFIDTVLLGIGFATEYAQISFRSSFSPWEEEWSLLGEEDVLLSLSFPKEERAVFTKKEFYQGITAYIKTTNITDDVKKEVLQKLTI